MRRIYWDTMFYAYWLEGHPRHADRVEAIYQGMRLNGDSLCSSTLAYAEVLTGPTTLDDAQGAAIVSRFFHSTGVTILPFPLDAAPMFANLRSKGIKPQDAMHLSIAAHAGVDLFLTNDKRLSKLSIPGLPFIDTLDTNLY